MCVNQNPKRAWLHSRWSKIFFCCLVPLSPTQRSSEICGCTFNKLDYSLQRQRRFLRANCINLQAKVGPISQKEEEEEGEMEEDSTLLSATRRQRLLFHSLRYVRLFINLTCKLSLSLPPSLFHPLSSNCNKLYTFYDKKACGRGITPTAIRGLI